MYPAQCFPKIQFKIWNSVVPRLHATYDLTGDGQTVIKGGWGRFAHLRYVDEILISNENVHLITFFRWHDLNGNKQFDLLSNDGKVKFFIPGHQTDSPDGAAGEEIALDAAGNLYAG